MGQTFESVDNDGDELVMKFNSIGEALVRAVRARDNQAVLVELDEAEVRRLLDYLLEATGGDVAAHAALAAECAKGYLNGRQDAIDDHTLVTQADRDEAVQIAREEGYEHGREEAGRLDLRRVAALEKAAEVAKGLRSTAFASAGEVTPQTLLTYALFLLDLLPMPPAELVAA